MSGALGFGVYSLVTARRLWALNLWNGRGVPTTDSARMGWDGQRARIRYKSSVAGMSCGTACAVRLEKSSIVSPGVRAEVSFATGRTQAAEAAAGDLATIRKADFATWPRRLTRPGPLSGMSCAACAAHRRC